VSKYKTTAVAWKVQYCTFRYWRSNENRQVLKARLRSMGRCGDTDFRTKGTFEASRSSSPSNHRGTCEPNQKVLLQESIDAITRI
jgi:hypothetical protein